MNDNAAVLPPNAIPPVAPAPAIGDPPPAPGAAGAAQNVPPPARRNRAPRRNGLTPSTRNVTALPFMYSIVAAQPFHVIEHRRTSTFVPSFIAAAVIIHHMNFAMAYTHRFLQGAPAWLPPMSFLYFGVLFIIQTLRAQREVSDINIEEQWFLEGFESMYDIRSLLISGPLVPTFQALAAFSGPFERYGDVTARLPRTWTCTPNNGYNLSDGLSIVLPNIPLYMDALLKSLPPFMDATDAAGPRASSVPFSERLNRFWNDVHSVDVSNDHNTRFCFLSPGAWTPISFTESQYNSFSGYRNHQDFPPRLDSNRGAAILSWAHYLRFYQPGDAHRRFYTWFSQVSSIMQRYCQFFQESVPLSAIPPASIAAGLPIWTLQPNPRLANPLTIINGDEPTPTTVGRPAYYRVEALTSLAAIGTHCDETLEEITEQCSSIALVNVDLLTSSGCIGPANAILRDGPVWFLPDVRRSPIIDTAHSISTAISSHYHSDSRQN